MLKIKHAKENFTPFQNCLLVFYRRALALVFVTGIGLFAYRKAYENKIYPGVYINNVDFSGKSEQNVQNFFDKKNSLTGKSNFILTSDYGVATISASQISFGYNSPLLAMQAYMIGRSGNFVSDFSLLIQAYFNGVYLPPSYTFNQARLPISFNLYPPALPRSRLTLFLIR